MRKEWDAEAEKRLNLHHGPPLAQSEVIGLLNRFAGPKDVVVCAAGSLPGDLHKLWRTRDPKGYHAEYGYSCMGYEIAGGLGVKMAAPDREAYVMVGDASYLMMSSEIVTSIQEGYKLNVILLDNHGFSSIGGLSQSLGSGDFGTQYRFRDPKSGQLEGDLLPIDFVANAASLGAHAIRAVTREEVEAALEEARHRDRTTVIVVEVAIGGAAKPNSPRVASASPTSGDGPGRLSSGSGPPPPAADGVGLDVSGQVSSATPSLSSSESQTSPRLSPSVSD